MAGISDYKSRDPILEVGMVVEGSSGNSVLLYSPEGRYLGEESDIGRN